MWSRRARRERHRTHGHIFGCLELEEGELRRLEREARGLFHFDTVCRRRQRTRSHDARLESLARSGCENRMNLQRMLCFISAGAGKTSYRAIMPASIWSSRWVVVLRTRPAIEDADQRRTGEAKRERRQRPHATLLRPGRGSVRIDDRLPHLGRNHRLQVRQPRRLVTAVAGLQRLAICGRELR